MTASVQSVADIANIALSRIGHPIRLGTLYDGSVAAKKILDIYSQTRDELLRQEDWEFSERTVALTLLKSAPAAGYIPPTVWSSSYPPLPWLFEYAYPTDCLKLRVVKPQPFFLPVVDPQPNVFRIVNDSTQTPARVILCNVQSAIANYTAQVTDPTAWDVGFVEAMVASLCRRLAPVLGQIDQGKAEVQKAEAGDEQVSTVTALNRQG